MDKIINKINIEEKIKNFNMSKNYSIDKILKNF